MWDAGGGISAAAIMRACSIFRVWDRISLIEKNRIVVPREVVPKDAPMRSKLFTMWEAWLSDVTVRENRSCGGEGDVGACGGPGTIDGTSEMGPGWMARRGAVWMGNVYSKESGRVSRWRWMQAEAAHGLEGLTGKGRGSDAVRDGKVMEVVDVLVVHGVCWWGCF